MTKVETQQDLDAAVGQTGKAVVLFHATWCPYCRTFLPVFKEMTKASMPKIIEAVVDDEDNPIWENLQIELIPTVLFYEDGKVKRRLEGRPGVGLTRDDLEQALSIV